MRRELLLLLTLLIPLVSIGQSCPDNNHPHMIDLGLPSGTMWACCYVGASSPEETGGYYAWGETEEKDSYTWATYIHCNGSEETCHDLGESIVGTQYDVAHVKWGDLWQMATVVQNQELVDNCTYSWTTINGVSGALFTGRNGASIFFPASGYRTKNGYSNLGINAWCWTGIAYSDNNYDSRTFVLSNTRPSTTNRGSRYYGRSVRPVSTVSAFVPLQLSENSVEIMKGEEATIEITSGNGEYAITNSDSSVTTATITGSTVTIRAIGQGNATITITDKKTGDQATIEVTSTVHLQLSEVNVSISKGKDTSIAISTGNGTYSISSSDVAVATAVINGETVDITAISVGTATITVTDTRIGETATISVTVYPYFSISESTLSMIVGDADVVIRLTGGSGSYSVTSSNTNVATATFAALEDGGNITIHAAGAGTATITVTDTTTGDKATIEVSAFWPFQLARTAVHLYPGYDRERVVIKSGNGSYAVRSSHVGVAKAAVRGSSVEVTAIGKGTATITVTDTETGQTATIAVTVTDHSSDPLTPTAPFPSNGAVDVGTYGMFVWLIPTFNGGKATHYELYLDTDESFSHSSQPYRSGAGNSCGFTGLQPGTKYYWKVKVFNAKGQSATSNVWNFTTKDRKTPLPLLRGDVNGDGLVSVADVMLIVNHILGKAANTLFIPANADLNADGTINVTDVMLVVKIILHGDTTEPCLVVWHKDGSKVMFNLSEKPKVTYLGDQVTITAASTVEYPFQAIRKMTIGRAEKSTTASATSFTRKGETITFHPADTDLTVKMTLPDGRPVKELVVRKGETTTLPLDAHASDAYMINVNGVTYKIKTR